MDLLRGFARTSLLALSSSGVSYPTSGSWQWGLRGILVGKWSFRFFGTFLVLIGRVVFYIRREWALLIPSYGIFLCLLTWYTYWSLAIAATPEFDDLKTFTGELMSSHHTPTSRFLCPTRHQPLRLVRSPARKTWFGRRIPVQAYTFSGFHS